MAQQNFDWLVGAFATAELPDWVESPTVGLQYQLVDPSQLEDKQDRLRVERVVGSVLIAVTRASSMSNCYFEVCERLYTTTVDQFGLPEANHDLDSVEDFDRGFMWERRQLLPFYHAGVEPGEITPCMWTEAFATAGASKPHPWWQQVDVQVKRSLRDREVLIYDVQVIPPTGFWPAVGGNGLACAPRLRVGVRF